MPNSSSLSFATINSSTTAAVPKEQALDYSKKSVAYQHNSLSQNKSAEERSSIPPLHRKYSESIQKQSESGGGISSSNAAGLRKVVSATTISGIEEHGSHNGGGGGLHHSPIGTSSSISDLTPFTSDDYPSSINSSESTRYA